jgi:hypothetical protein
VNTSALLFATAASVNGGPAAALCAGGSTLVGRLLGQLETLGVGRVWVVTRPGWKTAVEGAAEKTACSVTVIASEDACEDLRRAGEIAGKAAEPLIIGNAHVLIHREALAALLGDPRILSGVLTSSSETHEAIVFPIRTAQGRLLGAGSAFHRVEQADGHFLGFVKVDPQHREVLDATARRFAELLPDLLPGESAGDQPRLDANGEDDPGHRLRASREDVVALLVVGLVRSGVALSASSPCGFFYATPFSSRAAAHALEVMSGYDEERIALDAAVKTRDGFFTTFFVSPYSKYIARFAARRGWSPNALTMVSLAVGFAAAASFALGTRLGLIMGAVLLQASFTVDCVDGQLARYTRTFSTLGAWLDSVFDRMKEYVVYGGLAVGAARGFGDDVWTLAAAALVLQSIRHMVDLSYTTSERDSVAWDPRLPLEQRDDGTALDAGTLRPAAPGRRPPRMFRLARHALVANRALERRAWTRWPKRILILPIGERFALISLTAAIASPRATFLALLVWGGVAAVYGIAARGVGAAAR